MRRYYWKDGGFWLRPDPLLDKYINLSPYAYCNGNPLKYVDPDGREKHIFHKAEQSYAAKNFKDDNGIYFFAHGSINGYIKNDCGKTDLNEKIESDALAKYITDESDQWKKDALEGNTSMVFLYACHAGEGDNNLAQQLSAQLTDHENYVIAPMDILTSSSSSGALNQKYAGTEKRRPWGVYQNGELVTTIPGNKCPTKATVNFHLYLNQLWNLIKNYFKHENE